MTHSHPSRPTPMPATWPETKPAHPLLTRRNLLRYSAVLGLAGTIGGPLNLLGRTLSPAAAATPVDPVKSVPTYYTPDKIAAARRNIADYSWARAIRDARVNQAAPWIDQTDQWLWKTVTGQGLPRSYAVNEPLGSPITGTDIYQYGRQPWRADPFNDPWKLVDPTSDYVFPTNDFAAFYASALDEHGQFRRELGDESLLVNQLYPERGPDWGVDDGFGWVDRNGDKWTFIAYYNFFINWFAVTTTPSLIWAGLVYLRDAFLFTGDLRYAHAGLIILDRVADVYPAMDTGAYRREDGFLVSDGLSGHGKVVGSIWDCDLVREILACYDGFFPAIADGDDADVVPFLSEQAQRYGLPPKDSPAAVRANIENNLFRIIFPAIKDAEIRGNFGMHQSVLAMTAVVLDDPQASPDWIDWIFASGEVVTEPEYRVTGGDVLSTLVDDVDRDGFGNEGSPQYNTIWISQIGAIAGILGDYERYPSANLFAHPKARKLFASRHQLWMLNRYTPGIGDTGRTGRPDLFTNPHEYVGLFERYGDLEYAQAAHLLANGDPDRLYGGITSLDVDGTRQRIERLVDEHGPLRLSSENLTGFGFAALRTGSGDAMRGVWSYYGRNSGHGHADSLNLGLYGHRVDLAPDLGYPETADGSAREVEWNKNTIAHNTVVVDATRQQPQWVGQPHGFADAGRVQMFDLAAPDVYPQTSTYRRVTALVDTGHDTSYAVDVFRVVGGHDHHFSFHGPDGPVTTAGLQLTPQPTGSYAGPDIEPPPDTADPRPGASGFDWLSNVERDTEPPAAFSVDWKVRDTWDVHPNDPDLHLRLTMLTQADDVALADGTPARNQPGNPDSLRYLIAHRAAGQQLASQFVTVLEPYVGQPLLQNVRAVPVRSLNRDVAAEDVSAVRLELVDGRVDYVVSCMVPDALLEIDGRFTFRGSFALYSLRNGDPVYACHHNGTLLGPLPHMQADYGAVTGRLLDHTRELTSDNQLVVATDTLPERVADLSGSYVYVANDGVRNAVYPIRGARSDADRLVLDIGDATVIRRYRDQDDLDAGFEYDVAVGAAVTIPLTRQWTPR